MDLGPAGRLALIAAASKGDGRACVPALAIPGDVGQPAEVQAPVARTVEAFGGLGILVTHAGGPPLGRVAELTEADWQIAFDRSLPCG